MKEVSQENVMLLNLMIVWDEFKKEKRREIYEELTVISAITRGCFSGLKRKARTLVSKITKHICKLARGSAKSRGLSPWNMPFDVDFIGAGHFCPTVAFKAIPPKQTSDITSTPTNTDINHFNSSPIQSKKKMKEVGKY